MTLPARAALVGYWAFNDATGQAVPDNSGNGNAGNLGLTGGAEASDPTRITPGKVGAGALSFDPANVQRVTVPDAASLSIGGAGGNDKLTIAAWVNIANYANYNGVLAKDPSNGAGTNFPGNYELRIDAGTGQLSFLFQPNGGGPADYNVTTSTGPVLTGGYHHVAVTVDETSTSSTTINYYIDGVPSGSANAALNFGAPNAEPLIIGSRADLFTNFKGSMDEVALWSDALSESAILGLADGTYTPLTAPVPEPASLSAVALCGIALLGRRRR